MRAPHLAVLCAALLAAGCASTSSSSTASTGGPPAGPPTSVAAPAPPAERPEPLPLIIGRIHPEREAEPAYELGRSLQRPPQVAGNLDVRLARDWRYIIIHHSGTETGSEASFDKFHREEKHWRGVGYGFVIGNGTGSRDGLVEVTFRWEQQTDGAHAGAGLKEYNNHGIGICLVGNFEKDRPTPKQMEALVGLVNYLQERCRIPTDRILLHRHIRPNGTICPGSNFPFYEFISLLNH